MMGKREVGQLGIIDLIVSILIAELAVICIEDFDKSFMVFACAYFKFNNLTDDTCLFYFKKA